MEEEGGRPSSVKVHYRTKKPLFSPSDVLMMKEEEWQGRRERSGSPTMDAQS